MTGFLGWAGAVCMAAAGCTLLHMLVGKKGIGKVFRLVTAAFFLCAVLSFLPTMRKTLADLPQIETQTADTDALRAAAMRQLQESTETRLLAIVNTALESYDLKAEKVTVDMDTSEDGSISINSISVYVLPANDLRCSTVKQVAERRLGMEVEVHYAA